MHSSTGRVSQADGDQSARAEPTSFQLLPRTLGPYRRHERKEPVPRSRGDVEIQIEQQVATARLSLGLCREGSDAPLVSSRCSAQSRLLERRRCWRGNGTLLALKRERTLFGNPCCFALLCFRSHVSKHVRDTSCRQLAALAILDFSRSLQSRMQLE